MFYRNNTHPLPNQTLSLRGSISIKFIAVLVLPAIVVSFTTRPLTVTTPKTALQASKSFRRTNHEKLMDDFKTTSGEIINPYMVLRVPRDAGKDEVKKKYYTLSKLYHPDKASFNSILPGRCNNLEEVADEWERIKLSYEILSDKRLRAKYNRNSALSDPNAALGRGALDLLGWGLKGVGAGMFELGKGAIQMGGVALTDITKKVSERERENRQDEAQTSVRTPLAAFRAREQAAMDKIREETQEAREQLKKATQRR